MVFNKLVSARNWRLDDSSRRYCLFAVHLLGFDGRTDRKIIAMVHSVRPGGRSEMQCSSVIDHVGLGRSHWRYVHSVIHFEA